MKILTLKQIQEILPAIDLIPEIEEGFRAYSEGEVIVPPVGEMILDKGEVHIKYGYIKNDEFYVIKIASGFYHNPELGIPSGNGLMMLFSQHTAELICMLLDEGYLTNIRTAVAGAIVAKHLAPSNVEQIGIVGAGTQARLQLSYLKNVVKCRRALIWGQDHEELKRYKDDMEKEGFSVKTTLDTRQVLKQCNLIVTTTPSKIPLLDHNDLQKGTHITAMGSDTTEKQELDPLILKGADLVVADSIVQCMERGEIYQAIKAGQIGRKKAIELGHIISGSARGRTSDEQISIADLTGVAVQDIKIAEAIFKASADLNASKM